MKRVACFSMILLALCFSVSVPVSFAAYSAGPFHYYLPGFASGNGIWTGLALSNDGDQANELLVLVYSNDGSDLLSIEKSLPAGGQTAFPLSINAADAIGWIYVNSHQPLNGLAFFSTHSNPSLMADIPFASKLMTELEIPHIAQDETWDTTIFLCNPQDQSVTVTLRYITQDGTVAQSRNYTLSSKGSLACSLASAFTVGNGLGGKVTISADAAITAFALYSDTKSGGSYYAGINAVKSRRAYGVDPETPASIDIVSGKWTGEGLSFTVTEDKRITDLVYTYNGESDCYNYKFTIVEMAVTSANTASLHNRNGFTFDAVFSDKRTMSANITVNDAPNGHMTTKVISAEKSAPGEVLTSFSSPERDPRGLAFDGKFLWLADKGRDKIYKLDTTGKVITGFSSPGPYPSGLAFDGTFLWLADYFKEKIYKLDTTGKVITSFSSPEHCPRDLAFDGKFLWLADSGRDKIYKLDTTGKTITSFSSPGLNPSGLAFDGEFLWLTDKGRDKIYKLDTTGKVIASFPSPGRYPEGLTFDGTFLWCSEDGKDKIYKLNIR